MVSSEPCVSLASPICTIAVGLRPELGTRLATMRIEQDATFVGAMVLPISEIIARCDRGRDKAGISGAPGNDGSGAEFKSRAWCAPSNDGSGAEFKSTSGAGLPTCTVAGGSTPRAWCAPSNDGSAAEFKFHGRRSGSPDQHSRIVGSTPWLGVGFAEVAARARAWNCAKLRTAPRSGQQRGRPWSRTTRLPEFGRRRGVFLLFRFETCLTRQ